VNNIDITKIKHAANLRIVIFILNGIKFVPFRTNILVSPLGYNTRFWLMFYRLPGSISQK
jgi:hypothetical protein